MSHDIVDYTDYVWGSSNGEVPATHSLLLASTSKANMDVDTVYDSSGCIRRFGSSFNITVSGPGEDVHVVPDLAPESSTP